MSILGLKQSAQAFQDKMMSGCHKPEMGQDKRMSAAINQRGIMMESRRCAIARSHRDGKTTNST
jgi:hypothetical protein